MGCIPFSCFSLVQCSGFVELVLQCSHGTSAPFKFLVALVLSFCLASLFGFAFAISVRCRGIYKNFPWSVADLGLVSDEAVNSISSSSLERR